MPQARAKLRLSPRLTPSRTDLDREGPQKPVVPPLQEEFRPVGWLCCLGEPCRGLWTCPHTTPNTNRSV